MKVNLRCKRTQRNIGLGLAAILIPTFWWAGYSQRMETVNSCTVTAEYYVTAEYSETETYPVTSTDANGNLTTSLETSTDYWSEPASQRWSVTTVNGEIMVVNGELDGMNGYNYGVPLMPPHNTRMKHDWHFDNFEFHRDITLRVSTVDTITGEADTFREPASKNNLCINKLNRVITVKTWYGISYGSDF